MSTHIRKQKVKIETKQEKLNNIIRYFCAYEDFCYDFIDRVFVSLGVLKHRVPESGWFCICSLLMYKFLRPTHAYFIFGKNDIYTLNNISQKPCPIVNFGSCMLVVHFHQVSDTQNIRFCEF